MPKRSSNVCALRAGRTLELNGRRLAINSADAALSVYLCYSPNSGIVGGSSAAGFEGCSIVEEAGESIQIPDLDKDKVPRPVAVLPVEIDKLFDRASPALRQFALRGVTFSGYLLFLEHAL